MNTDLKKILLIFGGGLIVFWAFKKIKPIGATKSAKTKSTTTSTKVATDAEKKNAAIVVKAYSDAKAAGETKSFLDDMNTEFAKEYGMRVYTDKGSGNLFAADLNGSKIV